jgi:hypothetical protein
MRRDRPPPKLVAQSLAAIIAAASLPTFPEPAPCGRFRRGSGLILGAFAP